jgi:2-polyprenyl-3-methyl-5-hydroxy-6-metoxy-1,4-benzoquinol methylase
MRTRSEYTQQCGILRPQEERCTGSRVSHRRNSLIETERLESLAPLPWVRREHEARFRFASRLVRDRLVVDCACGEGRGLSYFATAGAAKVIALDCSIDALRHATRCAVNGDLTFLLADGCRLPLRSQSIEVFVSLETIEHVVNDRAFLDEAARVLAPAGVFVCSTPNRVVSNPGLGQGERPASKFHVREYARNEFATLLGGYFSSVRLYGQNPSPLWQVRVLGALGRLTSPAVLTRIRQMTKLRFLLPWRWQEQEVQPMAPECDYEYIVAVCSNKCEER